jgi:hypothetical protein
MEQTTNMLRRSILLRSYLAIFLSILLCGNLCAASADVAIIVRPDVPLDNLSFSEVRKLFLGDRQFWNSNIVYSQEMAVELVSAIPGAVAFVDSAQIPKGLKVLKLDNHLPGEKGYPLH